MAEYKGNDLVVEFGTTPVSATLTRCEPREESAEPGEIDVTHAGDTQQVTLPKLPGQPKVRVTVDAWDEEDALSPILGLEIGDKNTLVIYPEGKSVGKPTRTISNAILMNRSQPIEVEQAVKWSTEFIAYGKVAEGTYTT